MLDGYFSDASLKEDLAGNHAQDNSYVEQNTIKKIKRLKTRSFPPNFLSRKDHTQFATMRKKDNEGGVKEVNVTGCTGVAVLTLPAVEVERPEILTPC